MFRNATQDFRPGLKLVRPYGTWGIGMGLGHRGTPALETLAYYRSYHRDKPISH